MKAVVAIDSKFGIGVGSNLAFIDPIDQAYYRSQCLGKSCVVGYNTFHQVKDLLGLNVILDEIKDRYVSADVVLGGVKTYIKYAPFTTEAVITVFDDFNPDCDKFLDINKVYRHLKTRQLVFMSDNFKVYRWTL